MSEGGGESEVAAPAAMAGGVAAQRGRPAISLHEKAWGQAHATPPCPSDENAPQRQPAPPSHDIAPGASVLFISTASPALLMMYPPPLCLLYCSLPYRPAFAAPSVLQVVSAPGSQAARKCCPASKRYI